MSSPEGEGMLASSMIQRVLVVRLGAIGDVVNALVFATALKREHPEIEVGWVAHPLVVPLVKDHPHVDRVHVWKRGGGVGEFLRVVRELRSKRYDLAVDLQRLQKSALLARLSGASRVLGYDRRRTKEQSWIWLKERIQKGDPKAHMVTQYLEVVRALGLKTDGSLHELPKEEAAESWADEEIRRLGGAPLLLNLGATKPANRWEPERFGELAGRLAADFAHPVCLTGGPSDKALAEVARAKAGPKIHDLCGATSLVQLIALCRRARLFVTADTGPMHIAAACGVPIVALFGAADARRTGPYGEGHRVVAEHPACAPCEKRHCRMPRHVCMEDLSVDSVFRAIAGSLT